MTSGPKKVLLAAGVGVLAVGAAAAGLLVARTGSARGFPVGDLRGGVTAATLQVSPTFVYKAGARVIVFRPFAPDSPIPVGWCSSQGFFEDPETGSKFGPDGRYLAGPATRGLDRLRSTVVDGVLQVAPGDVTDGPARGAEVPATSLPPCDWSKAVFAPGVAAAPSPTAEPAG
jgi:hypothetical protein